jgi:hypothetical protein
MIDQANKLTIEHGKNEEYMDGKQPNCVRAVSMVLFYTSTPFQRHKSTSAQMHICHPASGEMFSCP